MDEFAENIALRINAMPIKTKLVLLIGCLGVNLGEKFSLWFLVHDSIFFGTDYILNKFQI